MSWRLLLCCLISLVLSALLITLRFLQVIRQTHSVGNRKRESSAPTKPTLIGSDRDSQGPSAPASSTSPPATCRLVVFLGSGGHTGEMIRLLHGVDFARFPSRLYLVSSGDNLSLAKAAELEAFKTEKQQQQQQQQQQLGTWHAKQIPRARRVHQSFLTAPFTTLVSLWTCFKLFTLPAFTSSRGAADLIMLNGPGSCVPIVLSAFLPRLLNLHSPQILYVESMARVQRLSLSGKILLHLVDRFFVQWEALADSPTVTTSPWRARREYRGLLV